MKTKNATMRAMSAALLLATAACSPKGVPDGAKPATKNAAAMVVQEEDQTCPHDPRTDPDDRRPRCEGMATASAPRAYRFVGGSGDPVDQVVCNIDETFVLDGPLFGVELSGGGDGSYRFVRTPDLAGVGWTAGGRYHIEFPDGPDQPGTMTTEGGGTTTAGMTSRETTGSERFTLTPVAACTQ